MNMNSVLSPIKGALSSRGFCVGSGRLAFKVISRSGASFGRSVTVMYSDGSGVDTTRFVYRMIRETFLEEVSPAAWIRGKGPQLASRAILLALLAAFEGVEMVPVIELDLRRPADDMIGLIHGSAEYMNDYLSAGVSDHAFLPTPGAVSYSPRKRGNQPSQVKSDIAPWKFDLSAFGSEADALGYIQRKLEKVFP